MLTVDHGVDHQAECAPGYVAPADRPEVAFVPHMLDEFFTMLQTVVATDGTQAVTTFVLIC